MIEPKKFIIGQTVSELPGNTLNALREGELRDRNLAGQSKLSNGYYAAPQASACVQLAWTGDEDLMPGSAVVLSDPIHTYEDKPSAPYSGVKFFCELPTTETEESGFFAVTATPLAAAVGDNQSVGYGYIPNACWAQVNVTDEAHETASLADGETLLQSAESGRVPIVWKPTGTGTKWCVVALSPGGGTSGMQGGFAFLTGDVSAASLGASHITLGEGLAVEYLRDDPDDPTSWEATVGESADEFAIYSKNPVLIRAGRAVTYQIVDGVKIINDKDCG